MRRDVFATSNEGELFIEGTVLAPVLVLLTSGLPLSFIGNDGTIWVEVEAAIRWVTAEQGLDPREHWGRCLHLLSHVHRQFVEDPSKREWNIPPYED